MSHIRTMETKNQAMGLEESIEEQSMQSASGSNGIDVHMIKSTEWGTVAILSASGYGNIKRLQESEIKTTTEYVFSYYGNQYTNKKTCRAVVVCSEGL